MLGMWGAVFWLAVITVSPILTRVLHSYKHSYYGTLVLRTVVLPSY